MKNIFHLKLFCATILFFSSSMHAITEAFLEGNSDKARLGRLARQADELVPVHQANESLIENLATTLDTNFAQTWTVIADIQSAVEVVETKVDTLDSDMATSFDGTWTALAEIIACRPTLISDADAVGDTITISSSGRYRLSADLTKKIVISADDVELDLNNYSIVYSTSGQHIISISSNADNVYIHDGTLNHGGVSSGNGIQFAGNNTSCTVERVNVYGAASGFVVITGGENMKFISCYAKSSSNTGFYAAATKNSLIQDCIAESTGRYGFYLTTNSEGNLIKNCTARDTGGSASGTVIAFRLTDGASNTVENCLAQGMENTSSGLTVLSGIRLSAGETGSVIINNSVQNFFASGTDRPRLTGIQLQPTLLTGSDLLASVDTLNDADFGDLASVHWSPDEKYILLTDEADAFICTFSDPHLDLITDSSPTITANAIDGKWSPCGHHMLFARSSAAYVELYDFLGGLPTSASAVQTEPTNITSITWSPDGKYIATGESDGTVSVFAVSADHSVITASISADTTTCSNVTCIDWSPSGKYIAVGENDSDLHVFSVDDGFLTAEDTISTATNTINDVTWSPYDFWIATGDAASTVRVFTFNGTSLSSAASYQAESVSINSVSWSPHAYYLVSGDDNGYVRVYTYNGTTSLSETKNINPSGYVINAVDWSPSGKYIVAVDQGPSGSPNGTVRVFDAMTICENCSVISNSVFDVRFFPGRTAGIGITGGGMNQFFANNICYDCDTNYNYGIPNSYYGTQNKTKPFDNVSMPLVY